MTKVFDTSSLLLSIENLFNTDDKIIITFTTLKELEHIKTSINKDLSIKYAARQLLQLLDSNPDKYIIHQAKTDIMLSYFELENNNDNKIVLTAYDYIHKHPEEKCIFITNDLAVKEIARSLNLPVESIDITKDDEYKGYCDLYLTDEEMAEFYSNQQDNQYNILPNQYINIYNKETKERVDTLCWTGQCYRPLKYQTFSSSWLGDIKPYKGDIYQAMAADSLMNNNITTIKGPAGSGKSMIAMGYLFYLLDREKINKIVIFCNTVATKNAAKLGFEEDRAQG